MRDASLGLSSIDNEDYEIGDGASLPVGAIAYTNSVSTLDISAAFLQVDLPGHTRLADSHGDRIGVTGTTFCVKEDECEKPCPDGTKAEKKEPLDSDPEVAISGAAGGEMGVLSGISHDEECKHEHKTPSSPLRSR